MPAVILLPRSSQDAPDKGPSLEAITTALLVLATVFVLLRFAARFKRGLTYGPDDWLIVVSLLFCFGAGGLNYGMIYWGLGRHAAILPPGNVVMVLKLLVAFECVYCTGVGLVKLSLLLMYARIFPLKGFRIGAYILGFITVGWVIAINCVSIFQCRPIRKAWFPTMPGECIDLKGSFIGNAVPNILTDIAILCMPVAQVWKLQVTTAQRASLIFMFLLGGFVLFASIYRFTTIMQFEPLDTTWTLATACTWCVVEVATGIISACLPTLRPLMRMVSSQFGSSRGRSGKDGNTYSNHPSRGNTELVTIGGTGGKRSQTGERHFKRLEDELIAEAEESERRRSGGSGSSGGGRGGGGGGGRTKYGNETTISRSSHSQNNSDDGVLGAVRGDGSSDQLPLTSIVVTKDVQWSERNNSTASEWPPGSGNGGGGYHGHYPGR
ncbi:Integral membrane protein [Lasiodiplodia theobromae]|uniref:Integral membrane protein n=1 Tax=Lasiodiplodia theobromae TaxID=45133 RepID=UPI0015C2DA51|nr:Integral membrane protein [Lasiodiplodia theobromae]KAF4541563.1 Integral membrane protein [Lasiodiplodia theobromae]